jgi:hypothetical protein
MGGRQGATILAAWPIGVHSAKETIAELEKQGIRKGDLVAWEDTGEGLRFAREVIESKEKFGVFKWGNEGIMRFLHRVASEGKRINPYIASMVEGQIKIAGLKGESPLYNWMHTKGDLVSGIDMLLHSRKFERGERVFNLELAEFLLSKKATILPIGPRKLGRDTGGIPGFDKTSKIRKAASPALMERRWEKILAGKKPRFVIVTPEHLPSIKRIVPPGKVIDLSGRSRREKIALALRDNLQRLRYRLARAQKAPRKMRRRK